MNIPSSSPVPASETTVGEPDLQSQSPAVVNHPDIPPLPTDSDGKVIAPTLPEAEKTLEPEEAQVDLEESVPPPPASADDAPGTQLADLDKEGSKVIEVDHISVHDPPCDHCVTRNEVCLKDSMPKSKVVRCVPCGKARRRCVFGQANTAGSSDLEGTQKQKASSDGLGAVTRAGKRAKVVAGIRKSQRANRN
ncbi:hypothetical protein VNI00_012952 [Paramarasmius palmivorus]|uniref:Zn(2)-C6 fungal-type domain-containing protein n=1 Tax=Paramarasmius palmivorus TaxID=297713 RepID=A0AAW0C167_9AGAR